MAFGVKFGGSEAGDHPFHGYMNNTVGMMEEMCGSRVVVRVAGSKYRSPNAMPWVIVTLMNTDGTADRGLWL